MSIDNKLDKIIDVQNSHSVVMAKMEVDLAHHIKRSDLHEEHLKKQDKKIEKIWYILIASAAMVSSKFGPEFLKWLGL